MKKNRSHHHEIWFHFHHHETWFQEKKNRSQVDSPNTLQIPNTKHISIYTLEYTIQQNVYSGRYGKARRLKSERARERAHLPEEYYEEELIPAAISHCLLRSKFIWCKSCKIMIDTPVFPGKCKI